MKNYIKKILKTTLVHTVSIILSIAILIGITYAAISWPGGTPIGETPGGKFMFYFNNILTDECPAGEMLKGYEADGTKICENYLTLNGTIQGSSFLYSSDLKLKKDINIISSPLEKIMQIKGVNFKWKKNGIEDIGVIAQDIEKVIPQAVKDKEINSEYKKVDYIRIIPLLIESIKEQQKEIEILKRKLNLIR